MYLQRNTEARSRIIVAMGKQQIVHICLCVSVRERVGACGWPGA
jgi:hypothetical protein